MTYTLDDRTCRIHTDGTGERITCEPPMGHAANAAFIYSLRLDDMREVEVPEETVTYDGWTPRASRAADRKPVPDRPVRLDTPEAARQAARLIDDERVAHIYVSGYVLIVQEENSPQVSSILLQYAERVRSRSWSASRRPALPRRKRLRQTKNRLRAASSPPATGRHTPRPPGQPDRAGACAWRETL